MKRKKISVITPAYNRQDCIERCISSVISQEVPVGWILEHIIVDDGSTDNTYQIINESAQKNENVRSFRFSCNQGPNAARNKAIGEATGNWIVFLDSDDRMLPGAISIICDTIENNNNLKHFLFTTDDTSEAREKYGSEYIFTFEDFLFGHVDGDFVHVFLRETAMENPFNEHIRIHEEIFFLQYFKKVRNIKFISKIIYHRDRNRDDHVTKTLEMYRNTALANKLEAQSLKIEFFEYDYLKTDKGRKVLERLLSSNYLLSILSRDRTLSKNIRLQLKKNNFQVPKISRAIEFLHIGGVIWEFIKPVVWMKHKIRG